MRMIETDLDGATVAAIERHYNRAKEKHPYFCDAILPHREYSREQIHELIDANLALARNRIEVGVRDGNVMWNELLNCEVWEATEAIANGDTAAAVEECFDCIAVLLRTIDVLEGRQKLGREGGAH
jgi:hypothetical protein